MRRTRERRGENQTKNGFKNTSGLVRMKRGGGGGGGRRGGRERVVE